MFLIYSAGSVIADFELSFSQLKYDVFLMLEEALTTNKSLGDMKMELLDTSFVNGIVQKTFLNYYILQIFKYLLIILRKSDYIS